MTHLIEYTNLHNLLTDLHADPGGDIIPIYLTPLQTRQTDQHGHSHQYTYSATIRAIDPNGNILSWRHITSQYHHIQHPHRNDDDTHTPHWDKLTATIDTLRQWLQTNGIPPHRIRTGLIHIQNAPNQLLHGQPIQTQGEDPQS